MIPEHSRDPVKTPINASRIGDVVRSDVLDSATSALGYLRDWYGQGLLFVSEFEPPDSTLNPYGTSGNPLQYYIITHMPDNAASSRNLAGVVIPWAHSDSVDAEINWTPDFVGAPATSSTIYELPATPHTITADYSSRIGCPAIELYDGLVYDPQDSAWGCGMLEIIGPHVASVSLWHAPTITMTAAQQRVTDYDVARGRVVRGYTGTGRASVGDLLNALTSDTDTSDDAERVTRRVLAQIGIGYGYYVGASATDERMFGEGFSLYAKGRTRRDFLDVASEATEVEPALVLYGSEGASVTITNQTTTDTWVYTIPAGGLASPTLIDPSDGTGTLTLTTTSTQFTIDVTTGVGDEIVIHTVSLWEKF